METIRHNPSRISLLIHLVAGLLGILAFSSHCFCAGVSHPNEFSAPRLTAHFAVADFDGDARPDFAEVVSGQGDSQEALYWIAFRLSGGLRRSLRISGPAGGLEISPVDVNDDGFLDVVVTAHWTRRPVAVLLNDGRGNFRLSSPASFPHLFNLSNVQLGAHTPQTDDFSCPLLYSGHDWNFSGLATRLCAQTTARRSLLGDFRTARGALLQLVPSRAPPADLSQS